MGRRTGGGCCFPAGLPFRLERAGIPSLGSIITCFVETRLGARRTTLSGLRPRVAGPGPCGDEGGRGSQIQSGQAPRLSSGSRTTSVPGEAEWESPRPRVSLGPTRPRFTACQKSWLPLGSAGPGTVSDFVPRVYRPDSCRTSGPCSRLLPRGAVRRPEHISWWGRRHSYPTRKHSDRVS